MIVDCVWLTKEESEEIEWVGGFEVDHILESLSLSDFDL